MDAVMRGDQASLQPLEIPRCSVLLIFEINRLGGAREQIENEY
jgi:hypothetical protein